MVVQEYTESVSYSHWNNLQHYGIEKLFMMYIKCKPIK